MKRYVLSRPAERDLDVIKEYLAARAGAHVARRVRREIRSAIRFLAGDPTAGHLREDLTTRPVRFWPLYSYLIVYDPESNPTRVLRVLHGMQDVEKILH